MSNKLLVVLSLVVCLAGCGSSRNSLSNISTTLTTQTANNTSAANGFANQGNGNLGANNVSKVDVHSFLYSGANTKVLAQLLLWFGQSNHMNVGYKSNDPAQVKRQIEDMISRGIDGVIVDWYGPNNFVDQATQLVMPRRRNMPDSRSRSWSMLAPLRTIHAMAVLRSRCWSICCNMWRRITSLRVHT